MLAIMTKSLHNCRCVYYTNMLFGKDVQLGNCYYYTAFKLILLEEDTTELLHSERWCSLQQGIAFTTSDLDLLGV